MASNFETISAKTVIEYLVRTPQRVVGVDVRSPGEFAVGSLPRFFNLPILTDIERHEVGLTYKTQGQSAAVNLGYKKLELEKEKRVGSWLETLRDADIPLVTCWRGGLRSEIAVGWIRDRGQSALKIDGGYKALRKELLETFERLGTRILQGHAVLAGPTGSGKTKLLHGAEGAGQIKKLDLEGLACHRGSAFGRTLGVAQPAPAMFENLLSLELLRIDSNPFLIEDESRFIGALKLPDAVYNLIQKSPVIKIHKPLESRVAEIFNEYVSIPLERGIQPSTLKDEYTQAVFRIRAKLGNLKADEISKLVHRAFSQSDKIEHDRWIEELLVHYYDKMYAHSFCKSDRKVIFEGNGEECLEWITNRSDLPKTF